MNDLETLLESGVNVPIVLTVVCEHQKRLVDVYRLDGVRWLRYRPLLTARVATDWSEEYKPELLTESAEGERLLLRTVNTRRCEVLPDSGNGWIEASSGCCNLTMPHEWLADQLRSRTRRVVFRASA